MESPAADDQSIRMLFVEDDEVDYLDFRRFVKDEGLPYNHIHAGSVTEGKAALSAHEFDVILMDYMLSDGTAFDLFPEVPWHIPVVIVTGSGDEELAVQAMKAGASDYLIKDPSSHWLKTLPITVHNAIKAKHSELALKEAHAELERRVLERTEELLSANQRLHEEIRQRESMEKALKRSEERFRSLTESVTEWIWEVNAKGVFTYVSPRVTDLLGFEPGEILGRTLFDLMTADEALRMAKSFEELSQAGRPFGSLEHYSERKGGGIVLLETSGEPFFDPEGNLIGYRGVARDVTERKRAEQLLIQSERVKAVAELASGVAHNFNNLLQIILSSSEMALTHLLGDEHDKVRALLERIGESCQFGAETAQRLQTFAGAREGVMPQGRVFRLSEIVEKAIAMSQPWWQTMPHRDGIAVTLNQRLQPDCLVRGEPGEFLEVAMNLIKNAVEAMPGGGEITVSVFSRNDEVVLEVRDTGLGVPPDHVSKVFEPFFTTKGLKGTGMGLASSYGIVVRHGGQISVKSDVGEGAAFTVKLPRAVDSVDAIQGSNLLAAQPLRALIIDDEFLIADVLAMLLEREGHQVFTAGSGEEGLEIFRKEIPDVVISDLGMPSLNGWQVARAIKDFCLERNIPKPVFLMVTGWGKECADLNRLSQFGVDSVLEKPANYRRILTKVREIMLQRKEKEV